MSKVTLNNITGGYAAVDLLNENFDAIEAAFENTLSRNGAVPNPMLADFDLNHKDILNGGEINAQLLVLNGQPVTPGTLNYNGVVKETQTATSGQTVFNLTTITYSPLVNNLSVYVDGVYQNPSRYTETSATRVTFSEGLHVGAVVDFVVMSLNELSGTTDAANVTYQPAGSGAVATLVSTKLQETVSVKDFGAVGDGVTDDTNAIQNALDNGGLILFPSGTYKITSRLSVDVKQTAIRGLGNVVINASTVTDPEAIRVYSTATYNEQQTVYNFQNTIENISFIGNRVANVSGISVGRTGSTYAFSNDITIRDCGFFDFDIGVAFTENAWRTHFDKCGFFNIGTSFVNFSAESNAGECMTFKDCAFINGDEPSAGMSIENGQFHFHNCSFPGGGDTGVIDIYGAAHVVFDGWNFETQPQSADHNLVQVRQSAKAVVQNSTIITNKTDQSVPYFIVQDSGFLTIKDCTVALYDSWDVSTSAGIKTVVEGGTNVVLENNTVYGTGLSTPITAWAVLSDAANRVYDGNAEAGAISQWSVTIPGGGTGTFTNVTTNPKTGTRNFRAVCPAGQYVESHYRFYCGDCVGRTIINAQWVQATVGSGSLGYIAMNFYTANGTLISTYGAIGITSSAMSSYTWVGQKTTIPQGTSYVDLVLTALPASGAATIDFDNIIVNII